MATSGSITQSVKYGNVTLTLSCTGTSIDGNYTTWSASLTTYSSGTINASANKPYSMTINGNTYSGNFVFGSGFSGTRTIRSVSGINIPHDGDGSKYFSISFSFSPQITYSGTYIGTVSKSGGITCNTIPRTSNFTGVSGNTIGGDITLYINRASSAFTHRIDYYIDGMSWTYVTSGATTSATFNLPMSLCDYIPNSTSVVIHCRAITYNGSAVIGTCYIDSTIYVPDYVRPGISSITISEATGGISSAFGGYVKSKSTLNVGVNAYGSYSSSIRSYTTVVSGVNTYYSQSFTSGTLQNSGTVSISSTVTDSRGRTASSSTTINVIDYFSPSIGSIEVKRCLSDGTLNDDGTYAKITLSYAISSVGNRNNKLVRVDWLDGSNGWTPLSTITDSYSTTRTIITSQTFSTDKSYEFRLYAADYFTSVTLQKQMPTAFALFNYNSSGHGVAIGKVSQKDALEVALPSYFDNDVMIKYLSINGGNVLKIGDWWSNNSGQNVDNLNNEVNFVYSSHNAPTNGVIATLSCASNTNYRLQIMGSYGSTYFYYRNRDGDNGTWTPWKRLVNSDETMNPNSHNHPYATWIGAQYASGGDWLGWYSSYNGTRRGYIQHDGTFYIVNESSGYTKILSLPGISLHTNAGECYWEVNGGTRTFRPAYNISDTVANGLSWARWSAIYCATGSVQTSDETKKKEISKPDDIYYQLAKNIDIVTYKFKDTNQDDKIGRTHFGSISQQVEKAMEVLGLKDKDFAGFCKDAKVIVERKENGYEKITKVENEYDYSLRYDELSMLKIWYLEEKTNRQQKQIDDLTKQVQELTELVLNSIK